MANSQTHKYIANIIYNYPRVKANNNSEYATAKEVVKYLVELIETWELGKTYYHDRDALVGSNIFDEFFTAVENSFFTIVVVTKRFKVDFWGKFKFQAAFAKMLEKDASHRFVAVCIDLEEKDIPPELISSNTLHFSSEWRNEKEEWDKLKITLSPSDILTQEISKLSLATAPAGPDKTLSPTESTSAKQIISGFPSNPTNSEALNTKETKVPKYERNENQRGMVLIINFTFHGEDKERKGSEKDVGSIKKFFLDIGYEIEERSDMTKSDFKKCLNEVSEKYLTERSEEFYCFIAVIMSHGNLDGIKTLDGTLSNKEIIGPFKNIQTKKFIGKPKVFIIQACRGSGIQKKYGQDDDNGDENNDETEDTYDESNNSRLPKDGNNAQSNPTLQDKESDEDEYEDNDENNTVKLPQDADIIQAYATVHGDGSILRKSGSIFIQAFLSVATKHYKDFHFEDILKVVRHELATNPKYEGKKGKYEGRCQMSTSESTSRKHFYL